MMRFLCKAVASAVLLQQTQSYAMDATTNYNMIPIEAKQEKGFLAEVAGSVKTHIKDFRFLALAKETFCDPIDSETFFEYNRIEELLLKSGFYREEAKGLGEFCFHMILLLFFLVGLYLALNEGQRTTVICSSLAVVVLAYISPGLTLKYLAKSVLLVVITLLPIITITYLESTMFDPDDEVFETATAYNVRGYWTIVAFYSILLVYLLPTTYMVFENTYTYRVIGEEFWWYLLFLIATLHVALGPLW